MTRDSPPSEPLRSSRPRTVVLAAMFMLFAGAVVAAGTAAWSVAAPREPSDHLIQRVMFAGLAVALTGVAGMRFFWHPTRNRRPWWHRTLAVLALLGAAYMAVHAIQGV